MSIGEREGRRSCCLGDCRFLEAEAIKKGALETMAGQEFEFNTNLDARIVIHEVDLFQTFIQALKGFASPEMLRQIFARRQM